MPPKIRSLSVVKSSSLPILTPASASNATPSLYSRRKLQNIYLNKRLIDSSKLTRVQDIQKVHKDIVY
jgi:hypothetical protein